MWAQIEKECLAIVSACDKWDLWIYGRQVNVPTDHQPLETIFKKPLHAAPRRLQKMMMRLQRYNIKVSYKKGTTLLLADTLSRAPLPTTNDSKQTNFEVFRTDIDNHPENPRISSQTLADIKASTANDPTIMQPQAAPYPHWQSVILFTPSHHHTISQGLGSMASSPQYQLPGPTLLRPPLD